MAAPRADEEEEEAMAAPRADEEEEAMDAPRADEEEEAMDVPRADEEEEDMAVVGATVSRGGSLEDPEAARPLSDFGDGDASEDGGRSGGDGSGSGDGGGGSGDGGGSSGDGGGGSGDGGGASGAPSASGRDEDMAAVGATVIRGGRWADRETAQPLSAFRDGDGSDASGDGGASGDADSQTRSGSMRSARIVLALVLQKTNIGVAVFHEQDSVLLWQQVATDKDFSVLRKIRAYVKPSFVVLPAPLKNNEAFMYAADPECEDDEADFYFVAGCEWSPAKAAQNIGLISLLTMPERLSPPEKRAYMSHILNPDCQAAFRAVGGLIGYLTQNGLVNSLERPDHPVAINDMRQANFAEAMFMSQNTQRALQVFQLDPHPLGHGSGKAKEGLSLFGVLGRTRSAMGSRLMQTWIAAPSTNIRTIQERQNLVALLRAPQFDAICATLCGALGKVKNVPMILNHLQAVTATVTDWQGLHTSGGAFVTMHEAVRIFHAAEPQLSETGVYKQFLEMDAGLIRDAVKWIDSVIDFPGSKIEGRITINEGFSADIDSIRECYAGLDEFLTSVGVQEMKRIAEETPLKTISSMQIVYLPQAGFMILLDHEFLRSEGASDELLTAGGLEFQFTSPQEGGYFKNEQCYILDAEMGDIHGALADLEAKAVRYLATKTLPSAHAFLAASQVAAELDCLVALATVANENDWVTPRFHESSHELVIENGRHALQELVLDSFIPNTFRSHGGGVHVITGPNASGKSVSIKQIALIVILAHIGSCVPAQSCSLGIIDAIYTRIASIESVTLDQSSFFIDASQVANMLHHANERSLVLLDEFGKGTNEVDGTALFAATLSELLTRPADRAPICCAATHFTEILDEPFLPMSNERLSTYSMGVMVENENGGSAGTLLDEKVIYLYRLVPGLLAGESRAIHCAQVAGVPREVLVRSIEVRSAIQARSKLHLPSQTVGGMPRMSEITRAVRAFMDTEFEDESLDVRQFLASLPL